MGYVIQDTYTVNGSTYNNLEEFKAFFDGKANEFFNVADGLNVESWDGATYLRNRDNIISESFDPSNQQYTRVTQWDSEDVYNSYRLSISLMNWDVEPLKSLSNQSLGLTKVTEVVSA